jgi:exonuclease III
MLKIATWNISEGISETCDLAHDSGKGNVYQETQLVKSVVDNINKYNLEIVCFQEFPTDVAGDEILKQKIIENTDLKYYSILATSPSYLFQGGHAGVAIFSKYPILNEQKTYFKNPMLTKVSKSRATYTSFDKGIIYAQIKKDNILYDIVTGHAIAFFPFDKKETDYPDSYQPLADLICELSKHNEKLIVVGDFNTDNLFALIPEINNKVEDILIGPTTYDYYEHRGPLKVDAILINNLITKYEVEKKDSLSDHYLCIANLE